MAIGKNKAKKIAVDMFINLLGTGIGLVVLQLIIYPIVAKLIDAEAYGQMQSIMSVVYMISGTLGTALSTTRLVREYDYQEKEISADFNLYNVLCSAFIIIAMPIALSLYIKRISAADIILIVLISIFNYTSNYFAVGFRLKINYKAIFINKILGSVGYAIGFILFYFSLKWEFIFIGSFLLETIYCIHKTDLIKEPVKKSSLLKKTGQTFANLGIANLMSRALTYFDKLLLYPLLGGTAVSIYYTANVFGKLILMTIEPITNVILSYLSKQKTVSKNIWKIAIPVSIIGCALMFVVCLIVSNPILKLFYPQWAEEAIKLVPLTTLCLAISAFINIMYPFTLKAIESNRQIIINAVGIMSYIISALLLYKPLGIRGCCIALLISYSIKLLVIFIFCFRRLRADGQ